MPLRPPKEWWMRGAASAAAAAASAAFAEVAEESQSKPGQLLRHSLQEPCHFSTAAQSTSRLTGPATWTLQRLALQALEGHWHIFCLPPHCSPWHSGQCWTRVQLWWLLRRWRCLAGSLGRRPSQPAAPPPCGLQATDRPTARPPWDAGSCRWSALCKARPWLHHQRTQGCGRPHGRFSGTSHGHSVLGKESFHRVGRRAIRPSPKCLHRSRHIPSALRSPEPYTMASRRRSSTSSLEAQSWRSQSR
mmetsp:Transcript_91669/g.165525  ORF Transcript_91669/g.165525 Transcript_91669/m.165525 type:complete len:247 (-) Transcript_91669:1877-2617(-)